MSYAGYGQPQYRPEPKVRFDAIGEAWGMVREKLGVWVVTMLIFVVINYAISFALALVGSALGLNQPPSQGNSVSAGFVIFQVISFILSMVISAFFQAGLYRMALKQVRRQEISVSDLFSAGEVVGPSIVTQLVYMLGVVIGTFLCFVPGMILAVRGAFAMFLAADKGLSGVDAIRKSWDALKGHGLNIFLFMFVVGLVASLGVLLCGVGYLVTGPIAPLALAILYHEFFDTEGPITPTLNMPLPPQSAYGPGQYTPGMTPPPPGGRLSDVPPPPGQVPPGQNPPPPGQMGRIDM